jgi:hypothetical protein
MGKKYNQYKEYSRWYNGEDFFYDHPVICGCVISVLTVIAFAGLFALVHKFELDTIEHRKEVEIEETIEKAKICQETGYCDSKNINIDYTKETKNETTK